MASAGFYSGLGQGLQGMAQSLSQYLAQRERRKERDTEQDRFQKTFDQSVRTESDNRAYRERQETRQTNLDEQALVEKVLGNIAAPTRVDGDFAGKAKRQGMGAFVKDAPATPIINPITHSIMATAPASAVASPMISARDQAAIDNLKATQENHDALLALKEQQLANQESTAGALAGYRMGMLNLGQENFDLRRQTAGAQQQAQAAQKAWQQAILLAKNSFSPVDAFSPDFGDKLLAKAQQYYELQNGNFMDAARNGKDLFQTSPMPNPALQNLTTPMPMDPSLMGGPSYKDRLVGGLTSMLPRSYQQPRKK